MARIPNEAIATRAASDLKAARKQILLVLICILTILVACLRSAESQTAMDQAQIERARQFLNRFADSPCLTNQQCRSWMTESHISTDDVLSTLSEVERLAADAQRTQNNVNDLQNQKRQLQQEDDSLRQQVTEKALEILRSHNFGFSGANATEVLGNQLGDQSARLQVGRQEIIITLFGYFEYDHDLDLTTGAKLLDLKFHPFVLGHGGTLGQQIDAYNKNAQLSIRPELEIADSSVQIEPVDQNEKHLDLSSGELEWSWKVRQGWFSFVTDTDGKLTVNVISPDHAAAPSLPVKVKGRPWWWPAEWMWEHKAEIWPIVLVLIVFVVTWCRKSFRDACLWLWRLMKHLVGKLGTD